jgi:asparagine synthase (glutamine-hydrolysing)
MCGICGIVDLKGKKRIEASIIERMRSKLLHRGPDGVSHYYNGNLAFGFTRLSIIDLEGGMQPLFNEDSSLLLFCNGEIFNYIELRRELIAQGHRFKTNTDVEVILHLYEESRDYAAMLNRLNGQFSFALFDRRRRHLFCARDHFGITPFFYTTVDDFFIFASEIKAILEHPQVEREVDLVGLDQIFSFPGLIAPRTMFKQIRSLENGHYLLVEEAGPVKDAEYWDVIYPQSGEIHYSDDEDFYAGKLAELIARSVKLRLRADVPVGLYLSGGLDSAIVSAQTRDLTPETRRYSFSIDFEEKDKSEAKYQQIMADFIQSVHSRQLFRCADIVRRLEKAVYHSECPLKETYNTASLALSEAARRGNIKVVLSGEARTNGLPAMPATNSTKCDRDNLNRTTGRLPPAVN